MADKGDIYERRRRAFLEVLAYSLDDPFIAVIGHGSGKELLALAQGMRRHNPLRAGAGSAAGSVICFCYRYHEGEALQAAQDFLIDHEKTQRARARRLHRATAVPLVVRFVVSADGSRDAWETAIARLLRGGPERFGLVCHMGGEPPGVAQGMQADIETFTPMMNDRTEVVLCDMHKTRPQRLFRNMIRHRGWSGITRTGLGLAELRRLPFATKE